MLPALRLPIPIYEFAERHARLQRLLAERDVPALVAFGNSFYDRPGPVAYLTGHYPPFPNAPFNGDTRGSGHACVFLPVSAPPTLFVDSRGYRTDLVAVEDVRASNDLVSNLASLLRERRLAGGRLGIVGADIVPYAFARDLAVEAPGIELIDVEPLLQALRSIKSPAEQNALRAAAEIAGIGLRAAIDAIQPGVSEHAVCAAGTAAALAAGADFVRYLRVHSGPWSGGGSRWPQATDRMLLSSDIVVLDIIGSYRGYAFDVNRTTVVGEPSAADRHFLETGLAATEAAVSTARAGATIGSVVEAGRRAVVAAGYPALAPRGAGHAIGIETVEAPYLMAGDETVLAPGMVLCIEPSIFEPGRRGCAIEQEVLITSTEPEVLTTFPTRLWT